MTNTIVPDIPSPVTAVSSPATLRQPEDRDGVESSAFARAVEKAGGSLDSAQHAEDAFAAGSGSLVDAMYERARADITLSVATAATGRILQDVQSLLSMQV